MGSSKKKLKKKCCKSFCKKGKACKRCPFVCLASREKLCRMAEKIKKKKASEKFEKLYVQASL